MAAFVRRKDIGAWWQDVLTDNEIRKIKAEQELEEKQTMLAYGQNQQILEMLSGLQKNIMRRTRGGTDGGNLPTQYDEMVSLFRKGGEFGEGGRAEVHRGAQQALAGGQQALSQTGMSSGTNVAGLHARVAADEAMARKKIEDERVGQLGGALGQAGAATLDAREIAQRKSLQLIQTLSQLRPNFVNY